MAVETTMIPSTTLKMTRIMLTVKVTEKKSFRKLKNGIEGKHLPRPTLNIEL